MIGLLIRTVRHILKPTPANKGEKTQPPPLDDQIAHVERELARLKALKIARERLGR